MTFEPMCREVDDSGPCRFAQSCNESRRRLQHYAGLRGEACWAFVGHMDKGTPVKREREPGEDEAA